MEDRHNICLTLLRIAFQKKTVKDCLQNMDFFLQYLHVEQCDTDKIQVAPILDYTTATEWYQ
jgi:hypothetical protein